MPGLEIPCPHCGKLHILPDRALLGRKGRCKRCGNKFLLHLPPPIEPFAEAGGSAQPGPPAAARSSAGRPAAVDHEPAEPAPEEPSPTMMFAAALAAESASSAPSARRRRRTGWKWPLVAAGGLAAAVLAAVLFKPGPLQSRPRAHDAAPAAASAPAEARSGPRRAKGKPISLHLVPMSAKILVHLRPAELWTGGTTAEEVRACLGPVGVWLEDQIKRVCLLEPPMIEEALFALVPSGQEAFELAVVVVANRDLKRSELIDRFEGELVNSPRPHYAGPQNVYYAHDARTFAVAPKDLAEELFESADRAASLSEALAPLVPQTDRSRQFTLLVEMNDARLGAKGLAPPAALPLLHEALDFLGDDVESAAWSLQFGDAESGANFHSQVVLRNRAGRSISSLQRDLQSKLKNLPARILELVYKTDPATIGEKKVIGRFPAMTKVVEQSTEWKTGERYLAATVELSERAGPNLALGALLTWNQTTLPGFSGSGGARPEAASGFSAAGSIADRLRTRISVEFNNKFLKEAIAFIGEEIGVEFKLDGPGMQRVGVTQNQRQDLKLENTPASAILYEMLVKRFKDRELCLIVDEQKQTATITSQVVATEKNLKTFPLAP